MSFYFLLLTNGADDVNFTLDSRTIYDDVTGDPDELFTIQEVTNPQGDRTQILIIAETPGKTGTAQLKVSFAHSDITTVVQPDSRLQVRMVF